jgi:hypothetical protein
MGTDTPDKWAREKLNRGLAIWKGESGRALEQFVPRVYGATVPPVAFVGFMMNALRTENTTEWALKQSFHEMGHFGVEGGMRDKPAPDPNPRGEYNNWGRLANDSRVVSLLGRGATMRHNAWKTAPRDQVAVGLVNVLDKGKSAFGEGAELTRPVDTGSLYYVAVAFMSWSAGGSRTRNRLGAWEAKIAAVPEGERWAELCRVVAQEKPGKAGSHGNAAYSVLRTLQKLAGGRLVAERVGQPTTWWDAGPDAATVETIVRHARGQK